MPIAKRSWTPSLLVLLGLASLAARALPPGLREVAFYPALGLFPGLLVAELLAGREREFDRWILGLALSPLVAALAGIGLCRLGVSLAVGTSLIAGVSFGGCLIAQVGRRLRRPSSSEFPERRSWQWLGWALGFAGVLALLPIVNPWLLVRADSWFHAGMVWEIVRRGIPPETPSVAGPPANYMWTYNFFLAQSTSRGCDPFVLMAVLNVVSGFLLVAIVRRLALLAWRSEQAATGAAALALVGLDAGTWLLWPLSPLRALTGQVRGGAELTRQLHNVHLLDAGVLYFVAAPFSSVASLIDKLTEGTALGYAWILLLLLLWSALAWLEQGRRRTLGVAALATLGLFFLHAVVALSVVPVMLVTLAAIWLLRGRQTWLPPRGRVLSLLLAVAVGAGLGMPYLWSVMRAWTRADSGPRFHYLPPDAFMLWTLLTTVGVVGWLAWRPALRSFRERLALPAVVTAFALFMTLYALAVRLPVPTDTKLVVQVFFPLALLAGAGFLPGVARLAARRGRGFAAAVLALVFGVGPLLTVIGFAADPSRGSDPHFLETPAERRLDAWVRERTPVDAVLLDGGFRNLLTVRGQRRQYLASGYEPFVLGFPAAELALRTAVMQDLYGPGADLAADAEKLRALGAPVFVVYRPEDRRGPRTPWSGPAGRGDLYTPVYAADGFHVFRVRETAGALPPAE